MKKTIYSLLVLLFAIVLTGKAEAKANSSVYGKNIYIPSTFETGEDFDLSGTIKAPYGEYIVKVYIHCFEESNNNNCYVIYSQDNLYVSSFSVSTAARGYVIGENLMKTPGTYIFKIWAKGTDNTSVLIAEKRITVKKAVTYAPTATPTATPIPAATPLPVPTATPSPTPIPVYTPAPTSVPETVVSNTDGCGKVELYSVSDSTLRLKPDIQLTPERDIVGTANAVIYQMVIDQFNVASNPYYTPNTRTVGSTYCNYFAADVAQAYGAYLPGGHLTDGVYPGSREFVRNNWSTGTAEAASDNPVYNMLYRRNMIATSPNQYLGVSGANSWLMNYGKKFGYAAVDSSAAQIYANNGFFTIGINSGHVIVVYPNGNTDGVYISEAGSCPANNRRLYDTYNYTFYTYFGLDYFADSNVGQISADPDPITEAGTKDTTSLDITSGDSSQTTQTYQPVQEIKPVCKHKYSNAYQDKCKKCGENFVPCLVSVNKLVVTKKKITAYASYYPSSKAVFRYSKGTYLKVIGYVKNSCGKKYYKLSDGTYIYSGYVR